MEQQHRSKNQSCSLKCSREYEKCIAKGEHESVCNLKRAQCDCGCYE